MRALLISTYDLGRQPFGLASPAAWLREAGVEVVCADLSRERLDEEAVRAADLVAFFLPMHTATRLARPVIDRVREWNPDVTLCAYGLYAPLNAGMLRDHGVTHILGGEFEERLVEVASAAGGLRKGVTGAHACGVPEKSASPAGVRPIADVARLSFRVPDRDGLPPLERYATLQVGAERRTVGYTEASRGCKHRCRHCPIVPIYNGRFRTIPVDVVVEDIRRQARAGAQHITFGDPDFFNGIGHARAVMEAFGREFPALSYDVTIKVEHLLQHAGELTRLRRTGCMLVTTAVESFDDEVLERLEKGHTRADFERVVSLCAGAGLTLAPTFVAFTPWTTVESYCDLLQAIDGLGLVDNVAPIQLGIRLLVTEGSRLLDLDDVRRLIGDFDTRSLTYPWRHSDPRVDALQQHVASLVGVPLTMSRRQLFDRAWGLAHEARGGSPPARTDDGILPRAAVPYLNEPWYC
ncbi:MAG TPA: CUAEP/CCAEP-tail radical SAM protein [Vicinamibacterales bacterium]|nr:CUAEP/CCAEP-tail radical SAM protein [Vicinamibacterales bacterium]